MSDQLLPPILYWSRSLAEYSNREAEADIRHGLIDATDANILMAAHCGSWTFLREMPADAVQLVDYVSVADMRVEYGVRWPSGRVGAPAPNAEIATRIVADRHGGQLVQRMIRTGQWTAVAS